MVYSPRPFVFIYSHPPPFKVKRGYAPLKLPIGALACVFWGVLKGAKPPWKRHLRAGWCGKTTWGWGRKTYAKQGGAKGLDSCLHRNDKGVGQKSLYNPYLILYSSF
jgi:hypothetical protein